MNYANVYSGVSTSTIKYFSIFPRSSLGLPFVIISSLQQAPAPGNHWWAFHPIGLSFHQGWTRGVTRMWPFLSGYFHLAKYFWRVSPILCPSVVCSFVLRSSIPPYGCTRVCCHAFGLFLMFSADARNRVAASIHVQVFAWTAGHYSRSMLSAITSVSDI